MVSISTDVKLAWDNPLAHLVLLLAICHTEGGEVQCSQGKQPVQLCSAMFDYKCATIASPIHSIPTIAGYRANWGIEPSITLIMVNEPNVGTNDQDSAFQILGQACNIPESPGRHLPLPANLFGPVSPKTDDWSAKLPTNGGLGTLIMGVASSSRSNQA